MNIVAILPESIGGRLTTQSIIDGLVQNGVKVIIFDELLENKNKLIELTQKNMPDFILGYDYSAVAHKIQNGLKIKTINYFSDFIEGKSSGVHHHKYLSELKKEDNFVFYWDKQDSKRLNPEFKHLYYLPHFVNTEIYKNINNERTYDLMFAGRLDTDFRLNEFLKICKQFPNTTWFAINSHFEDAINRCNKEDKQILSSAYKGFIDNEKQMANELNKSKIVINFHSQGKSAVNYRTFQAMACGCIVLSDYQEEMNDFFNIDKDLLCYKSFADFCKSANEILNNKNIFNMISKNAEKCINKKFNAKIGVSKILEILDKDK